MAIKTSPSDIKPEFSATPEEVAAELSKREPIFHRPEFGTSRSDFERMTSPDFWETGASGRRYSREYVLEVLEERFSKPQQDVWEVRDFRCRKLCNDTFLVTYTLLQDKIRLTRRATIWQSTPDGWKVVYHQGTVVQESD